MFSNIGRKPQNGWFIMVPNPIKLDDLGVPLFLETPILPSISALLRIWWSTNPVPSRHGLLPVFCVLGMWISSVAERWSLGVRNEAVVFFLPSKSASHQSWDSLDSDTMDSLWWKEGSAKERGDVKVQGSTRSFCLLPMVRNDLNLTGGNVSSQPSFCSGLWCFSCP